MTFAFDEQFAMFDITPVENQFILEYLPAAKGEYVKVYLYGLLCCYHPKGEMNIGSMSRELGMSEEEIMKAFRYWERRGIVRRIHDHPPEWKYVNIKQKSIAGDDVIDPEYVAFSREIENSFDGIRDFHGSEIAACFEWKDGMHLPTEVIVMLLKHMARTRGKSFKIKDAEKLAMKLSDEKAYSIEDAEEVLSRDEAFTDGFRRVLRKLGKKYNPSDANLMLFRKWTEEWHFTQEAIEEACDRTGTSDPSLALVDAILDNTRKNNLNASFIGKEGIEISSREREELRQVMKEVGIHSTPTPQQKSAYSRMRALYPQSVILLAARECALKQKNFDSVLKLLQSWQDRGFIEEKQIIEHIRSFHEKEDFLRELRGKWSGKDPDIGQKMLQLLEKWENEYGMNRDLIRLAADYSFEAKKPLSYMDSILTAWREKGVKTPDQVKEDRGENPQHYADTAAKSLVKTVPAQNYEQRNYSGVQDEVRQRMISMMGDIEDA